MGKDLSIFFITHIENIILVDIKKLSIQKVPEWVGYIPIFFSNNLPIQKHKLKDDGQQFIA